MGLILFFIVLVVVLEALAWYDQKLTNEYYDSVVADRVDEVLLPPHVTAASLFVEDDDEPYMIAQIHLGEGEPLRDCVPCGYPHPHPELWHHIGDFADYSTRQG